ncbi:hypothetical protein MSAS_46310 [Mycobacterium saskatchewanense]|uniref:Uncharacterized protein n=1 Tax=Mycobacterium saskatchewanense TaxID=220927 RepID=A0AAJ3NQX8_9MYCO|nr:hypothetical protein AWC23_12060 [Mycobacterium saskatchewanense]BBX65457.1 hypothetical protein MSAS_46310 [Mycobacterium saskatchewanense]
MPRGRRYALGVVSAASAIGAAIGYRKLVRPWMYAWGACAGEMNAGLPGDELVAACTMRTTRGVTIDASPEAVWQWLVQIGEDRGGFYSYDWLERLVGARIRNTATVRQEWQRLHVGSIIWLARRYGRSAQMVVAAVEPGSHLVMVSPSDFRRVQNGAKASGSWAFYLRPYGLGTRLLARGCGGAVGHIGFDVPHFVMEQKMLRGIRDRASRS